jgi:hypothetical protein
MLQDRLFLNPKAGPSFRVVKLCEIFGFADE